MQLVSWTLLLTVAGVGFALSLLCLIFICLLKKKGSATRKKNRAFGIKRAGYFRDKFYTKPCRNPTPVTNPDRGAHYLKKSPSPTGVKSPPGASITPIEEYHQKKAALQGKISPTSLLYADHCETSLSGRRASSCIPSRQSGAAGDQQKLLSPNAEAAGSLARRRSSPGLESGVPAAVSSSAPSGPSGKAGAAGSSVGIKTKSLGTLHATVKYCFDKDALVVTVNRCVNLPAKDQSAKSSDPYVKLQLLPEKQHKVKTRVMRRTLNPVYDEDFTFYGIHYNQLRDLTLHFVVLSFDRYSRDDVIGELMVDLEGVDLSGSEENPVVMARDITPRSYKLKTLGRGELLVSLCYQPAANRITAVVLKARNLPKMDITGLSDPYVKIYLLYNDQRISKKKTHVKKRTLNPVFNESFVFDLPSTLGENEGLSNISLEFLLLDWDRVTKNEVIGRLELGSKTTHSTALHHWNEVTTSPRRQIAEWHKLEE